MITSLSTEGTLFYSGHYIDSGRALPVSVDDMVKNVTLNLQFLTRMQTGSLLRLDPSVLIQGEQHGMDNDVEHVSVEGCCEDCYSAIGSESPQRFTKRPWTAYRLRETSSEDFALKAGTMEVSGMTCEHVYNDVYWHYPKYVRIYDADDQRGTGPMYDEFKFIEWCSTSLPNPYGKYGTVTCKLGVKSEYSRHYYDGRIYNNMRQEHTLTFAVIMYSKVWDGATRSYIYTDLGLSAVPIGLHPFQELTDECYWECLRLIPDFHQSARSKVFEESFNAMDKLDTNNLANAQQLLDMFKKLIKLDVKGLLEIPKTLKDWWLWYRYTYTTTKMDVEEFIEYFSDFKRKFNKQRFTLYTTLEDPRESITVKWTCGVTLHTHLVELVDQLDSVVQKLGLYPGMVNTWDLIPYSFVVDWFLPLGDIFQQLETNIRCNTTDYVFERINYSVQCSLESGAYEGLRYRYYRRWSEDGPPPVRFWIGEGSYEPSTQTTLKRITDGVCLFLTGG